jgi:hypothetical protein
VLYRCNTRRHGCSAYTSEWTWLHYIQNTIFPTPLLLVFCIPSWERNSTPQSSAHIWKSGMIRKSATWNHRRFSAAAAPPFPFQKPYTNTMSAYSAFENVRGIVHRSACKATQPHSPRRTNCLSVIRLQQCHLAAECSGITRWRSRINPRVFLEVACRTVPEVCYTRHGSFSTYLVTPQTYSVVCISAFLVIPQTFPEDGDRASLRNIGINKVICLRKFCNVSMCTFLCFFYTRQTTDMHKYEI